MTTVATAKFFVMLCAILVAGPALAQAAEARYIPLHLILGARWDGQQSISYPAGRFTEGVTQSAASTWDGPKSWTHPKTGRSLTVYFRSRAGRNAADQIFAVRDDQAAIGRVADSRFGITACDQEPKYPLGFWRQGEVRTYGFTCWYGDKPRAKVTTITIEELDYTLDGAAHCLRHGWILRDKGEQKTIDHRVYIFCPDRGMVREWKVS